MVEVDLDLACCTKATAVHWNRVSRVARSDCRSWMYAVGLYPVLYCRKEMTGAGSAEEWPQESKGIGADLGKARRQIREEP